MDPRETLGSPAHAGIDRHCAGPASMAERSWLH